MNRELYTHISTHLYSRYFEKLIYIYPLQLFRLQELTSCFSLFSSYYYSREWCYALSMPVDIWSPTDPILVDLFVFICENSSTSNDLVWMIKDITEAYPIFYTSILFILYPILTPSRLMQSFSKFDCFSSRNLLFSNNLLTLNNLSPSWLSSSSHIYISRL